MKTINKLISPKRVATVFGYNKTISIKIISYDDRCVILFLDRNYNYHIIEYSEPKKERDIHTKEKSVTFLLANGIDKIKISRNITTDQYFVWNEIEKALSVTTMSPIHDIDGFQKLIMYGNLIKLKNKKTGKFINTMNNYMIPYTRLSDVNIIVYHFQGEANRDNISLDPFEDDVQVSGFRDKGVMDEFADAAVLQCAIYANRINVTHRYQYIYPYDYNVNINYMDFMTSLFNELDIDEYEVTMIVEAYDGILEYPNNGGKL